MINKLFAPKELANLHKALQEFDVDQSFDPSNSLQNALKQAFYNDLASANAISEPISTYEADLFFYVMQKQAERKNIELSLESPLWEDQEELAKTFKSFRDLFINNVVAYEEDGETPVSQDAQASKLNVEAQRPAYENVYGAQILNAPAPEAPTLEPVNEAELDALIEQEIADELGIETPAKDGKDFGERLDEALEGDFDPEALAALAAEKQAKDAGLENDAPNPRGPRVFDMEDFVMDDVSGALVDKKLAPYLEDNQFKSFRQLINSTVADPQGNTPSLEELAEIYDFKKAQKTPGTAYDNSIDLLLGRNDRLEKEEEKHSNALMWYVQAEFEKELAKHYTDEIDPNDKSSVFNLGNTVFGSEEGHGLYPEIMRYQNLADEADKPNRVTGLVSRFAALDEQAKKEEKPFDFAGFQEELEKENNAISYGIFEDYAKRACEDGRYADQLFSKSEEDQPTGLEKLHKDFTQQISPLDGRAVYNDNIVLGMRAMEKAEGPEAVDAYTRAVIHRTLDAKAFDELTANDYSGENKDLFDNPELRQMFFNGLVNERAEKRGIDQDDYNATEKLSGKTIDQISKLDDNRRKAFVSAKFDKTYEESQTQDPQKGQKITPMTRIRGVGSFLKTNWVGLVGAAGAGLGARWVLENMLNPDQLAAGLSIAGDTGMLGLTVATGGVLGMVSGAVGNIVFQSWQGYTIARDAATADAPHLKGQYWKLCVTDRETRRDVYRSIRENFSFKSLALGTALGGTVGAAFAYLANTELLGNLFNAVKGIIPGLGASPTDTVAPVDGDVVPQAADGDVAATPSVDGDVVPQAADGDVAATPSVDGDVVPQAADGDVAATPPAEDPAALLPGCDIAAPLPEGIDDTIKTQIIESIRADGNVSSYEAGIIDRLENGDLGVQLQAAKDFTATMPDTPLQKEILTMLDTGYGDLIHHPEAQENSNLMRALTQINSDLGFESLRDLVQSGIQDGDPKLLEAIQNVIQAAEQGHSQSVTHLEFAQSQFPDSYAAALELNQSEAQRLSACFADNSASQPAPAPEVQAEQPAPQAEEDGPLHCDKDNPQGVTPAPEAEEVVVEEKPEEPAPTPEVQAEQPAPQAEEDAPLYCDADNPQGVTPAPEAEEVVVEEKPEEPAPAPEVQAEQPAPQAEEDAPLYCDADNPQGVTPTPEAEEVVVEEKPEEPAPAPEVQAEQPAPQAEEDGPLYCDKDNPQGVAPAPEAEEVVVEEKPEEPIIAPAATEEPLVCTADNPYGEGASASRISQAFEAVSNAEPLPVATVLEGTDPNYEQVIFEANAAAATDQLLQNTAYADNGALVEEGGKIYYATGTGTDMVVQHVGDTADGLFVSFVAQNPNIAQAVNYEQVMAVQPEATETAEQTVHVRPASRHGLA